jgi:hypothetical protein
VPVADAVSHGGVGEDVVRAGVLQELLGCEISFVHQQQSVVARVLDDVHLRVDRGQHRLRLLNPIQSPQRHVEPVAGGDGHVLGGRYVVAHAVGGRRALEITLEIVGEPQVVPDVRLQGAGWNAACVGKPVGFHLVGLSGHQLGRVGQILDGGVEFAHRDEAMAAVAVEACIAGMHSHACRVNLDRFAVPTQIGQASSEPDDRVHVLRCSLVGPPRLREASLALLPHLEPQRRG